MSLSILIGHIPISLDINSNLNYILKILSMSKKNDFVIFPEGAISGYDVDISFLNKIEINDVIDTIEILQEQVTKRNIYL